MTETKTYKAIYEVTLDGETSEISEVVTLPVEVAERIIAKIEDLAVDNEMVNIISIEETDDEKSSGMGIVSGFLAMFGR